METAGDCYIVAGALMKVDEDGFTSIESEPDGRRGAENIMAFSKVALSQANCEPVFQKGITPSISMVCISYTLYWTIRVI